ncbi:MAG: DUF2939 domain-containing protein [Caulobacteraceae bacterium]
MTSPRLRLAASIASLIVLAGCATSERLSAAGDVHSFLVAVRDDDRPVFDAHVDRPALEARLQERLVARTRSSRAPEALKGVGLVLSGPASRLAGSIVIRPAVFRAVAEYYGYRPDAPVPGRLAIAGALRSLPGGRVCASAGPRHACLLVFADEAGAWRLTDFAPDAVLSGRR